MFEAPTLPLNRLKTYSLIFLGMILLGMSLQLDLGAKANTYVRLIDLILNLLLIAFVAMEIAVNRKFELWHHVLLFLAWRSWTNVLPVLKLLKLNLTEKPSVETVEKMCLQAKADYRVLGNLKPKKPCIYVANHALWSMDDIVALGALARLDLMIVINMKPSGLTSIPPNCRKYLCTIDRSSDTNGFSALKEAMRKEVLENGKSLIVFAEDMKIKTDVTKPALLRSGTFKLAHELGIPVVPLWIDWPCQFPTLLNSTEKVLRLRSGGVIENRPSWEDLRNKTWVALHQLASA